MVDGLPMVETMALLMGVLLAVVTVEGAVDVSVKSPNFSARMLMPGPQAVIEHVIGFWDRSRC